MGSEFLSVYACCSGQCNKNFLAVDHDVMFRPVPFNNVFGLAEPRATPEAVPRDRGPCLKFF